MSAPARPRGSGRRSAGRFCACAHARSPSSICVHSRASLRFRSERCAHARAFGLRERHGLGRLGGRQELSKTALQDLARKVRRDSSLRAACPPPTAPNSNSLKFSTASSFQCLKFSSCPYPFMVLRGGTRACAPFARPPPRHCVRPPCARTHTRRRNRGRTQVQKR